MTEEHKRKIGEANKISHAGKKLSEKHKNSIRLAMLGRPSPFRGGTFRHTDEAKEKIKEKIKERYDVIGRRTPIVKALRGSSAYREWRECVFERDNFTCQFCGVVGGDLNADHIVPFAHLVKNKMELWDLDNGRTLCVPCHKTTPTFARNIDIWSSSC